MCREGASAAEGRVAPPPPPSTSLRRNFWVLLSGVFSPLYGFGGLVLDEKVRSGVETAFFAFMHRSRREQTIEASLPYSASECRTHPQCELRRGSAGATCYLSSGRPGLRIDFDANSGAGDAHGRSSSRR